MARWVLVLGVVLAVRTAVAEPLGTESLARGIRAFESHDYAAAATAFDVALARGHLSHAQTLTAYVDLGVTLVALGRTKAATRAFEEAALIDPKFVVPPRSGRQATSLANQARRKQESLGPYRIDADVPGEVQPDKPFHITVELDEQHASLASLVRVAAVESGGKTFDTVEPSAPHVAVDIPAEVAVPGTVIALRFELLDAYENRLATLDKQVIVGAGDDQHVGKPQKPEKAAGSDDAEPTGSGSATGSDASAKHDKQKPARSGDDDESDDSDQADVDHSGPWSIPHGSKQYAATRAKTSPKIDGVLDDPVWQTAPVDDRFLSTKSKPYGKPTTEPTAVQVAYDAENLYVAFRCRYSKPRDRADSFAADEQTLLDESEYVAVIVDAEHSHTGGYEFVVSPAGVRADAEISDQGNAQNLDWHGIWTSATSFTADGWTAELKIPWGTMYMSSSDDPFDIGIEFERHEPISGEVSLWTLHPPATELYDTNFFGHLEALAHVYPGQRLLILPYLALAFDQTPMTMLSQLTDFTGTGGQGRIYAGGYLRLHPPGPFRLDATFNPDFSAVTPDTATANFDRFELEYPEVRPFFAEDDPRFQFGGARYFYGDLGAQLFYSRRLGIITNVAGFTELVPILWGVKSVIRDDGFEGAIMNVETVKPESGIALDDNATVARVSETVAGQRFGAIAIGCEQCGSNGSGNPESYVAGGVDSQIALYEHHLVLSGFYSADRTGDQETSAAGEGTVSWKSQDIYAKATLQDIGKDYQAPLGFFETTGVLAETVAAGYTPVVRSDHVQQVTIDTQLQIVHDRDTDALIYQRAVIGASLETIDGAQVQLAVAPATEVVTTPFPIGSSAATGITIADGTYHVVTTAFDLMSPPNRMFVFGVRYYGGDLFNGTRQAPGATIGVNLGRFTARASYMLYILKFDTLTPPVDIYGHDVNVTATYAYTPLARTTLVVEGDTVAARASALLTTSVQFGALSSVALSLRGASGSTYNTPAPNTFYQANVSAILSLQLGASPF